MEFDYSLNDLGCYGILLLKSIDQRYQVYKQNKNWNIVKLLLKQSDTCFHSLFLPWNLPPSFSFYWSTPLVPLSLWRCHRSFVGGPPTKCRCETVLCSWLSSHNRRMVSSLDTDHCISTSVDGSSPLRRGNCDISSIWELIEQNFVSRVDLTTLLGHLSKLYSDRIMSY